MKLNNIKSNSENVVANNLNYANFYILKNIKIKLKNNHHMLFFPKDVITVHITKLVILFTPLMNIE
jgi:hypothetical protein